LDKYIEILWIDFSITGWSSPRESKFLHTGILSVKGGKADSSDSEWFYGFYVIPLILI
jgi:hypothetical protein